MLRHIFLLLTFLCALQATPATVPVHLVSHQTDDLENFPLLVYVDKEESFDIRKPEAEKTLEEQGTKTLSRFVLPDHFAAFWFAFTLENDGARPVERIISCDEGFPETLDLFYREGETWIHRKNGARIPYDDRGIETISPAFRITLEPGEIRTYYLKVQTLHRLLTLGFFVQDPETFYRTEWLRSLGYVFYFGAALVIILYNLFLFIALRDRLYLYYVLFGLNFFLFVVAYSGYHRYLDPSLAFHYLMHVPVNLFMGFVILFMRRLLNTSRHLPRLDKALLALMALFFLVGLLVFLDVRNYFYIVLLGMPGSLAVLAVGLYAWWKRVPLARYFVLGQSFYLAGVFMIAGVNFGLLPYNLATRYSYIAGSLVELVFFSLLLAYRVRLLEQEKSHAQAQLIREKERKAEELDRLVHERTRELRSANRELERLSRVDGLTGAYNRRHFDQLLEEEWRRMARANRPLCLVMCDIDYFKKYNDTHGHQAGDRCIRAAAKTIRAHLRRPSDLCARYGGEEFALVLPETGAEAGRELAETIRKAIREQPLPDDAGRGITMSFGVAACVPEEGTDASALLRKADEALYRSKGDGRNRVTVL